MSALKSIAATFLFIVLLASSTLAQNRQAASNRSQAVLTIQVYVAPTVLSPQPPVPDAHATMIDYNLSTAATRLGVEVKTQEQTVTGPSGETLHRPVKTVTIVLE